MTDKVVADHVYLKPLTVQSIIDILEERDIDAVLSGVSGSRHLRGVISRLEAKQQSLIFGDALPMPVVVHTRSYDETFYSQLEYGPSSGRGIVSGETSSERLEREINELF